MTWIEKLAEIKVWEKFIGWCIIGVLLLAFLITALVFWIISIYKKHSKKYEWNGITQRYEKKEKK